MISASIYGRMGGDPVARTTRTNKPMVTASLAVNVARHGEDDDTCWISLAAFGKSADTLLRHGKGDLLAVMGPLTRRRYTNKQGAEVEGWSLTVESLVSARTVRPGGKRQAKERASPEPQSGDGAGGRDSDLDDQIPF